MLLASSYILSSEITDNKPNMIHHYNRTKGGTDTFDQLCHSFSTARRTNRWPMRIFFGILDQAMVNARILLKCHRINRGDERPVTAVYCLETVIRHLVTPHLQERYRIPSLRLDVKYAIGAIINQDVRKKSTEGVILLDSYVRCGLC